MNLDQILEMWKDDAKIDKSNLEEASRLIPELHAKYLQLLANSRLKLRHKEFEQKELMKSKWLWYNGKLDGEEISKFGWKHDPFDGLKILKSDMQHFVEADKDLVESEAKIEYIKTVIDTLNEIIKNITWRHSTIKNMIDIKKFEAGF